MDKVKEFFENLSGATLTFNTFWTVVFFASVTLIITGFMYPFLLIFGSIGIKVFLFYSFYRIIRIGLGYEPKTKHTLKEK